MCAAALAAAAPPAATAPATQTAPPAPTSLVKRGSLPLRFDANGYFAAVDPLEVKLSFKQYAGELIVNAVASPGGEVNKGSTVLEIDAAAIKRQLAAAESEAAVAHANLTKAETDAKINDAADAMALRQMQTADRTARENVTWWEQVEGPETLASVELSTKQMQWGMDDSTEELEQLRKMYKSESLTSATADIVVRRALHGQEVAKQRLEHQTKEEEHYKDKTYPLSHQQVLDAAAETKNQLDLLIAAQTNTHITREAGLFAARTAAEAAGRKLGELRAIWRSSP